MVKIAISRRAIIRITITVTLILLTIFANFIAIKRMAYYAIRANFYDKLSVAYDIGGINGLRSEFAKIKAHGKLRHELAVIAEFEKRLDSLKDPEDFIDNALAENKKQIMLLKNLRSIAITLILIIFILRIIANLRIIRNKEGLK
jgi:hypothetical protein